MYMSPYTCVVQGTPYSGKFRGIQFSPIGDFTTNFLLSYHSLMPPIMPIMYFIHYKLILLVQLSQLVDCLRKTVKFPTMQYVLDVN